ncbi:MAG TPA: FAD-dependent oxidoreductase [Hyphomonas sp.]|nr:hypothetical protein [Hyphomonas sp.]HRJ00673.1 FAD-dependent oxidoreductase [Hyphomonas sp.]HRK69008.1 FAD-dependent oxidoreductase [Hyphomonas sp.]
MIRDSRQIGAGATVQAETCIIGAGPAGLTLALELAAQGRKVLLLEAGDFRDYEARDALAAPAPGFRYGAATGIVMRQRFGGNANAWMVRTPEGGDFVRFAAFQAADFEPRAATGNESWPFRAADLLADEQRAAQLWKISRPGPAAGDILPDPGHGLVHAVYQFPNAQTVTRDFQNAVQASPDITLLLNAIVTRIEFEGRRAVRAVVATAPGKAFQVEAATFVAAAGTLSACRLLFNSPTAAGHAPGNSGDALGRYLMDHPCVLGGVFYPADLSMMERFKAYDIRRTGADVSMTHLVLSDDRLRKGDLLALGTHFFPRESSWRWNKAESDRRIDAIVSAAEMRRAVERRKMPERRDIVTFLAGLDGVFAHFIRRSRAMQTSMLKGGWSWQEGASERYSVFEIVQSAEQAPHRENRVFLTGEKDALGRPRISVDWEFDEADEQKIIAAQKLVEDGIAASGLGRIDHARPDGKIRLLTHSSSHQIGGLRMGTDPATSVTDGNGRVHGTENLYVAGAGLFPTGSYANPTWLISVLAVRLARHLAKRGNAA